MMYESLLMYQQQSICASTVVETRRRGNRPGRVISVSRYCRNRDECMPGEFAITGQCTTQRLTTCKSCFYGIDVGTHHCIDGGSLEGATDRSKCFDCRGVYF